MCLIARLDNLYHFVIVVAFLLALTFVRRLCISLPARHWGKAFHKLGMSYKTSTRKKQRACGACTVLRF